MRELFLQVLNTSLLASILICITMILNKKFLINYSHAFKYFLSILIMVRMLFIFKIKLNIPILNDIFTNPPHGTNFNYSLVEDSSFNFINILMFIWLIGFFVTIIYYIYLQTTFYLNLKSLMQSSTTNDLQNLLNIKIENQNLNKNIKLKVVNGIPTPLVVGIFKSTIILPKYDYTEKEFCLIFNHELTHVKRKDNLLKLLMIITTALHWFNPFVYILRRFFHEQCELSCDEHIIKNIKFTEVKEYALLLVNSMKHKNNLKTSTMSSKLVSNKKNLTKRRIEDMLNLKLKKKGTFIAAMSIFLIGGTVFAFADSPKDHGIESYTFTESSEDAKEIPNKEDISSATLKSDSTEITYNNGKTQEFSNKDYSLGLKAAE
ncbi:MAG: M56 family metallopeptidase [Sarcina sp.]